MDTNSYFNVGIPRALRLKVDGVRLARARRGQGRPPHLRELVIEGLQQLVVNEARR